MVHPGFYVGEAVGEGGENSWSDGFGGDVELSVVGIAVKVKSMAADDVAKWEHIEDEEDGAKHTETWTPCEIGKEWDLWLLMEMHWNLSTLSVSTF